MDALVLLPGIKVPYIFRTIVGGSLPSPCSCPQTPPPTPPRPYLSETNRSDQTKAISSLPHYTQLCSRILPLVRDHARWAQLHQTPCSEMPGGRPRGDIATYWSRGWCRLEILCALCPKKFSDRSWRPGPVALRMIWHHDPTNTSTKSIGKGCFYNVYRIPYTVYCILYAHRGNGEHH